MPDDSIQKKGRIENLRLSEDGSTLEVDDPTKGFVYVSEWQHFEYLEDLEKQLISLNGLPTTMLYASVPQHSKHRTGDES